MVNLGHFKFNTTNSLSVGNSEVRCKRRVANYGRQGVTMLMREPVADRTVPVQCKQELNLNHWTYYLVRSAWPGYY